MWMFIIKIKDVRMEAHINIKDILQGDSCCLTLLFTFCIGHKKE